MDNQKELDDFIARAGFTYGWRNLESWARRMAEQAVEELAKENTVPAPEVSEAQIDAAIKKLSDLDAQFWSRGGTDARYIMRRLLQAASVIVPAGWKLVPIEPTAAMLAEVEEEVGGSCYSCSKWNASHDDCRRVYAAMLSAAPAKEKNHDAN